MLKLSIGLAVVLVVVFVGGYFWGQASWQTAMESLRVRLTTGEVAPSVMAYSSQELEGLPEPVRRYFQQVLTEGQPLIRVVQVTHSGSFNMGTADDHWQPFTSEQSVATSPRGFVWDARIRMAPGLSVSVVDAYVAGQGVLEARLLGLITVMRQPQSPELDQGELLRFFAEAPWYPTALLPSQGVEWQPLDDKRAMATLTDSGITVSVTITFNDAGLIETVRSEERYREVDGAQIATPWEGRFWDYERQDGMLVPLSGEVAWLLPEGPKPYWRGRISDIRFEYFER